MFRHPLRGSFLLLSLCLAAAPPARAGAPLDVEEVTFNVAFVRTTLGDNEFEAEIRVTGTGLNNGTLQFPTPPGGTVAFDKVGDDLVLTATFASETQLNAELVNGDYVLRVNNDTAQATLSYTRPLVPNPAISQPGAGDTVAPGPIEVLFEPCTVCVQLGDSIVAVLEDDMGADLADATLDDDDESWVPDDGMGGDLSLPAQAAFAVRVTHTAVRQDGEGMTGSDADDFLLFTHAFIRSDEVDFETGFPRPTGHFCLAANHPAPPMGCETLADPLLQLFDTSGMFTTQVDGHDVDVAVNVEANGQLTGTASADLDDNASNETGPAPLKGKLGGGGGEVSSKLSFSLANEGSMTKLKVRIADALSITGNVRDREQTASGTLGAVKIKEATTDSDSPLPDPPLGWLLEYDLAADGTISNAELALEGGRTFPLTGTNKFNFSSNESSVKLTSDPKGISVTLKKVRLDDASSPMAIDGGDLSYKALGQSGRAVLP